MEVLEIRPARVSAALVAIGDMLVASPIGADGPRPSRWIGAVTEHIIVEEMHGQKVAEPSSWRQWRVARVDGVSVETTPIPADGWVWVHLPVVDGPAKPARTAPPELTGGTPGVADAAVIAQSHVPDEPDPANH